MRLEQDILIKLPDCPHWRWVVWHVLEAGGHPDSDSQVRELARFAKDRWPNWDEMLAELGLDIIDDWNMDRAGAHPLDTPHRLWLDPIMRTALQRGISGGLDDDEVASLFTEKTMTACTKADVALFRLVFFDLESVGLTRTLSWMDHRGLAWQELYCPLPNEFRQEWARFKLGKAPSLDGGPILQQLLMQAFTAAELAMRAGLDREWAAMNWQKQVMNILKHARELGYTKGTGGALPAHLTVTVLPTETAEELDPSLVIRRKK